MLKNKRIERVYRAVERKGVIKTLMIMEIIFMKENYGATGTRRFVRYFIATGQTKQ